MPHPLESLRTALQQQWDLLRSRLEELPEDRYIQPSELPGWAVGDLIAHLGVALSALATSESSPESEPLPLSEYVTGYGPAAEATREASIQRAGRHGVDPLAGLDQDVEAAFAGLDRLSVLGGDAVVMARRGPLTLSDLVRTRLIELVVHGYDLAPVLGPPAPVIAPARRIVTEALLAILQHRTGYDLDIADEAAWIRTATGRLPWAEAVRAGAVRPEYLSDGTPDLTRALPLF